MIECKLVLPWFDPKGNELKTEHDDLRNVLISRFGSLHRIRVESLYKDMDQGHLCCDVAFEYRISCKTDDFKAFKNIARDYGHRCRQSFIHISYGYAAIETVDLVDIKDDANWQAIANQRYKERMEMNRPWPVARKDKKG